MQAKESKTTKSTQYVYWYLRQTYGPKFKKEWYLDFIEQINKISNKYYFNTYELKNGFEWAGIVHLSIRKREGYFKTAGWAPLDIRKAEWEFYKNKLMKSNNKVLLDGEDFEKCKNIVIADKVYDEYLDCIPHPWQTKLIELIESDAIDRNLWWLWESIGNIGKTVFTKHLCLVHGALMLSGASKDIKHGVTEWIISHGNLKVAVFDLTRTSEEYISYQALEEVKNGMFFTTKYESRMVLFNKPHIIIFANFPPELWKSSMDRWKVIALRGESEFDYYKKQSHTLEKLVNPNGVERMIYPNGVRTKLNYFDKCMDFWHAYDQKYRHKRDPEIVKEKEENNEQVEPEEKAKEIIELDKIGDL